jgi:hypothetical protein
LGFEFAQKLPALRIAIRLYRMVYHGAGAGVGVAPLQAYPAVSMPM